MGIIALEGMKFHGYHGLYENERKNGNSFLIDVELEVDYLSAAKSDDIDQTVDYEDVYLIVKDQLKGSSYLLEHLAHKIMEAILKKYGNVDRVKVRLSKLNPPVGGPCDKATVVLEKESN